MKLSLRCFKLLALIFSFLGLLSLEAKTSFQTAPFETAAIDAPPATSITQAVVTINPTKGNQARGSVTFTQVEGGVKVTANIQGLTPGKHGFHIHEFGDCSADDASSAGGHFNPTHTKHGGPDSAERHAGDLGNIVADATGKASYERVDKVIKLNGEDTIVGRSVIVHANPDDYVTQPTGNAGARVGCGIIIAH